MRLPMNEDSFVKGKRKLAAQKVCFPFYRSLHREASSRRHGAYSLTREQGIFIIEGAIAEPHKRLLQVSFF